ncbi:broad substrate specificity ATP-binding cassette transporter ABCG2-like [Styela clava]
MNPASDGPVITQGIHARVIGVDNPALQQDWQTGEIGNIRNSDWQSSSGSAWDGNRNQSSYEAEDDCYSDNTSISSSRAMVNNKTTCIDEVTEPNSLTKGARQSIISFHGIRYEVQEKLDDVPLCGKMGDKEILKGVSGLLKPGLNAIMGPTGSGKTSLLDILAKRKDPRGLKEGIVLLDGDLPPVNFRLMSGYVVQDDVVMGTLSVRENLAFSANLRLSGDKFNAKQRADKVSHVIKQLGLQNCADTKVGNEFIRGVSGGERKRVNIGMELILDPPIIFLDEPTTGLDANTANAIILLLYNLAKDGRNIILSIHQPRYSIFSLFDHLILLQQGNIIYRGAASEAVDYFSSIGYTCPQFHNPADFFLDIVGGDVATAQLLGRMLSQDHNLDPGSNEDLDAVVTISAGNGDANHLDEVLSIENGDQSNEEESEKLLQSFKNSSVSENEEKILESILSKFQSRHIVSEVPSIDLLDDDFNTEYPNGFFHQLAIVSGRTVRNLIRNPMTSIAQVLLMVFFGVLMGLIYYQLDLTPGGLQNRAGAFFFLIMMQVMSNLSALELFIKQRAHFLHESASGYYRVSVYFLALVFADLIPNRVIPNIVFSSIIYFMMGFQLDAGKFFFFVLALVITAMAASSLAFLVSASVRIFALANILVAVPYLLMMMFGGFLANTTTLLDWLEWIKWVSIFRYGINALTINEMSGLVFIANSSTPGFDPNSPSPCFYNTTPPVPIPGCTTGEMYMKAQGIPYGTDWDLWLNIVALSAMALGLLLLSYIQLRRIEKFK